MASNLQLTYMDNLLWTLHCVCSKVAVRGFRQLSPSPVAADSTLCQPDLQFVDVTQLLRLFESALTFEVLASFRNSFSSSAKADCF